MNTNTKQAILKSDFILSFGVFLSKGNEQIRDTILRAVNTNNTSFAYMHPIDDVQLKNYYSQFIKYEVGSEEGVSFLLLDSLVKKSNEKIEAFIDDLDIGYISAESSAGEEEFEELLEKAQDKENKILLVGSDIFTHERLENILKILVLLKKYSDFEVLLLDEKYQKLLDEACEEIPEEIEELDSYNGTILYAIFGKNEDNILLGSQSFARIAKILDGDEIYINYGGQKYKRKFVLDKNLYGTISLCSFDSCDDSALTKDYVYKQVKIEKAM